MSACHEPPPPLTPIAPLPVDLATLAALRRAVERPGTLPADRERLRALLAALETTRGRG